MKILTICRAGLVRSVALNDVLKLHYENTDVLSCGADLNSKETLDMLCGWADKIIIVERHYLEKTLPEYKNKVFICELGPDVWNSPKNPDLIGKVWNWIRENKDQLGVVEHNRII